MAVAGNGLHLLLTDVAGPHVGVAVLAASAGHSAVIVVDEAEERRRHLLDIGERVVAADEGVAGVHTDAEPRVGEALDKGDELVGVRQQLRALAGWRLQK